MADIRPFRGLRYAPAVIPDLGRVLSPPYDAISPAEEDRCLASDPHNIVRIELGPKDATDRYAGAAETLARWRTEGVLTRDTHSAFYITSVSFEYERTRRERLGLIARVRLVPFGESDGGSRGRILRHEKTLPAPKEDRLRMLRATRTNTSSIFGLVDDAGEDVLALLRSIITRPATASAQAMDGTHHALWVLDEQDAVRKFTLALASRDILIADGHHRYETALRYADESAASDDMRPERFVMMYLARMQDPGLILLGYHRTVRDLPSFDANDFLAHLMSRFALTYFAPHNALATPDVALLTALRESDPLQTTMGCAIAGRGLFLLRARHARDPERPLRETLDVSVLERDILRDLLGLDDAAIHGGRHLTFHHDPREVLSEIEAGRAQLGFFLKPVDVTTVARIASDGEVMPQKSTWFTPKVPTGLVLNPLEE
jgi:uncharacterized protein (DUF1015 family)